MPLSPTPLPPPSLARMLCWAGGDDAHFAGRPVESSPLLHAAVPATSAHMPPKHAYARVVCAAKSKAPMPTTRLQEVLGEACIRWLNRGARTRNLWCGNKSDMHAPGGCALIGPPAVPSLNCSLPTCCWKSAPTVLPCAAQHTAPQIMPPAKPLPQQQMPVLRP